MVENLKLFSGKNVFATFDTYDSHVNTIRDSLSNALASRSGRGQNTSFSSSVAVDVSTTNDKLNVGQGIQIAPWGTTNTLPNDILKVVNFNNLCPGLLEFKEDMLFGGGIQFLDKNQNKNPIQDNDFTNWLDSWDVEDYLYNQICDYQALYNVFGKFVKNKKGDRIAKIEHIPAVECRVSFPDEKKNKKILVAKWDESTTNYATYETFDRFKEFTSNSKITAYHHFRPSSGFKNYGMPKFIGALAFWIPLATKIPEYHFSIIKNTLSAMYHVQIPMDALTRLKELKNWTSEDLDTYIKGQVENISEMLTGSSNAGKTIFSYTYVDQNTKETLQWKITPIDSNSKKMSEGYLELFNDSNQAITSAFQVQPSLACIQLGDKMSSGSEILNAYNLHMQTRTNIPRSIILKALNIAININFPGKGYFADFKNIVLVKQEENKTGIAQ